MTHDYTWPDYWPQPAIDAVESTLNERPDLDGPQFAALMEVGELLTAAYALDEVARAAGYVSKGAAGHDVVHPATDSARMHRTAAAQILSRLTVADTSTTSGRQRANARKRWSTKVGGVR